MKIVRNNVRPAKTSKKHLTAYKNIAAAARAIADGQVPPVYGPTYNDYMDMLKSLVKSLKDGPRKQELRMIDYDSLSLKKVKELINDLTPAPTPIIDTDPRKR